MKLHLRITAILLFMSLFSVSGESILIASVFSLTGNAAKSNIPQAQVVKFAVDEINRTGGINGNELVLLEIDNNSTALGSQEAALKAVESGASAVVGASWSSHSLAMALVLQDAGIPMITPSSTNDKVTEAGDYIFRICFTDSVQGLAAAIYAYENLHAGTAVVLTNTENRYSIDLASTFISQFTGLGGDILWEADYIEPVSTPEYTEKVIELDPELIFIPGYPRDSAYFIRSFRRNGVKAYFLGGDGWSQDEMYNYSGKALDGSYYISHWYSGIEERTSLEFVTKIRNELGFKDVNAGMALAYDAVRILKTALENSGSAEPSVIRDSLKNIHDFRGVTGTITMNESGNPEKDLYILRFKGGNTEFVQQISPRL